MGSYGPYTADIHKAVRADKTVSQANNLDILGYGLLLTSKKVKIRPRFAN